MVQNPRIHSGGYKNSLKSNTNFILGGSEASVWDEVGSLVFINHFTANFIAECISENKFFNIAEYLLMKFMTKT